MIKPPPSFAPSIASDAQKLDRMRRLSLVNAQAPDAAAPTAAPLELAPQVRPDESAPPAQTLSMEAPVAVAPRPEPMPLSAQTERAAALFSHISTAASQPSGELLNSINLVLPPKIFDAIERAAQSRRWTKKCLILAALRQFGVDIPEAALIPDGRRIRGRQYSR